MNAVDAAVTMEMAASLTAVATKVESEWTIRYTADKAFHEFFPKLKGILFSLHRKGKPIEEGRYYCDVTDPKDTYSSEVMANGQRDLLTRSFPADFPDGPGLPLLQGDYRITWHAEDEDGLVKRTIAETTFRWPDDLSR